MGFTAAEWAAIGNPGAYGCLEGVCVVDGIQVRIQIGLQPDGTYGIGLFSRTGESELTADGFSGAFADFAASGIYNSMFVDAIPGALPLGTYRDDPAGHTVNLDFWTAWYNTGAATATVVADATWPGGNYVQFQFAAVGTNVTNNIALTTDLFPVTPGTQLGIETVEAGSSGASTTLSLLRNVRYYTASGVYISTSSTSGYVYGLTPMAAVDSTPNPVPLNARLARVEIIAWEYGTHDPSAYYNLGEASIFSNQQDGSYPGNLNVGGDVAIGGHTYTSGYIQAGGAILAGTAISAGTYISDGGQGLLLADTTGGITDGVTFGPDTFLYRRIAGVLNTNSSIEAAGSLLAGDGTTAVNLVANGAAGQARNVIFQTAGLNRWQIRAIAVAEGGSDTGSDMAIYNYHDSGANIGNPLLITRATGLVTLANGLTVTGAVAATGAVTGLIRQLCTYTFNLASAPGSATSQMMYGDASLGMAVARVRMPWAGSIVGIAIHCNAARTAGTLIAKPDIGGTPQAAPVVQIDGTNTSDLTATAAIGTTTFAAVAGIGVDLVGSSFTPTANIVTVILYVMFDGMAS